MFFKWVGANVGKRTQLLGDKLLAHLTKGGMPEKQAMDVAKSIAVCFGKLETGKDKSPTSVMQLVFIGPEEWTKAFELADQALKGEKIHPLASSVLRKADTAADIAMFGRMLTDKKSNDDATDADEEKPSKKEKGDGGKRHQFGREAAVQVAHAMTTHRVVTEDDYYVAVDDLNLDEAGTSFIGSLEYGAGVYYLYACIDCELLVKNLGGDENRDLAKDIAQDALAALVECAASVAPRGKQASFASRAKASLVLAERGAVQPRTLAAAFLKPVTPSDGAGDLAESSIDKLEKFRANVDGVYGPCAEASAKCVATSSRSEGTLAEVIQFARDSIV